MAQNVLRRYILILLPLHAIEEGEEHGSVFTREKSDELGLLIVRQSSLELVLLLLLGWVTEF